jgi:citrate synthase
MAKECNLKNTGLRGVKVADTKISYIDGEKGILIYRGYRIEDLAKDPTFEEVAYLLLKGEIPGTAELDNFKKKLAENGLPQSISATIVVSWVVSINVVKKNNEAR